MKVIKYNPNQAEAWDTFIAGCKNQTFLFNRGFMDYHADRFEDFSMMVYDDKDHLVAVVPANLQAAKKEVISHQGLTYGGIVTDAKVKLLTVLEIMHGILYYLHQNGIETFILKQIPAFYNLHPTDELEYAMFVLGAEMFRRDIALVIDQENYIPYTGNIRREGNKAEKLDVLLEPDGSISDFWNQVLIPNLADRYEAKPVHSLSEIELLKLRFPQNIRQFNVWVAGEIVAGALLLITPQVAHCQYISASDYGRKSGALNHLFKVLIDNYMKEVRYFDFGTTNENSGYDVNSGMLFWKESFGGRARKHDFYKMCTQDFKKLQKFL